MTIFEETEERLLPQRTRHSERMDMKRQWVRIEVPCGPGFADELAAEIAEAFEIGVEVINGGVCLYLHEDRFLIGGREKLERVLSDVRETLRLDALPAYSFSPFEEEDWLERWKLDFKPLRVRKRLVIAPTWEEVELSHGDRIVRLDPGQAFGTGHHETTRLCLEWLEDWSELQGDRESKSLLDVGTGSGILAIAGALLGFGRILALDNDPEAIEVARENLVLNGVADRIMLQVGTVADIDSLFDVVLANIQALPLIEMASLLVQRMADTAKLVLSGILTEQMQAVQAAYEAQGLKLSNRNIAGEWCLLEFERSKEGQEQWSTREREPGLL